MKSPPTLPNCHNGSVLSVIAGYSGNIAAATDNFTSTQLPSRNSQKYQIYGEDGEDDEDGEDGEDGEDDDDVPLLPLECWQV